MTGGWKLTLTCSCGVSEIIGAVIPGLLVERAAKAGWVTAPDRPTRPQEARDGLCGYCQAHRVA